MFKQIAFALFIAFVVIDFSQACAPPPPPPPPATSSAAPGGRRRRSANDGGITVAVSTLFDFDVNENAADIAALGQQLKQLSKSQQLDLTQFGSIQKTPENEDGHLLVRYTATSGNCDQVKAFVTQAVQLSPIVSSASIDCNGNNVVIDKQQQH